MEALFKLRADVFSAKDKMSDAQFKKIIDLTNIIFKKMIENTDVYQTVLERTLREHKFFSIKGAKKYAFNYATRVTTAHLPLNIF